MSTFSIDLLSGNQFLFSGNFTNSGMTTFSGITTANNGLTSVGTGGRTVKLGGILTCATTITRGVGNTAGIEYGGDYSASYTNRSLVDKGYVDNKVSGNTPSWNILTNRPAWLTGTTLNAFQSAHIHSQYLTGVTWNTVTSKPSWVGSGDTHVQLVGNTYRIYSPTGGTIGAIWGHITGTLSGQTDLQLSLNNKLNVAIPITYNALIALMNASGLTKAQFYIITDFQTIHNIYDGKIVLSNLHYGGIVPLNVQALSTSELSNTVTSTLFPQDLIYYDVRDNVCEDGVTPRKGKITYRKNVISNIEAHYDYKEVVFRRWKFQLSGYTQWVSGGEYNVGDQITYNHYLYTCNKYISGSTSTPDILLANFSALINDNDYLSWQSTDLTIGGNPNGSNTYPVNALDYKDFYTFTNSGGNEKSVWFNNISIGYLDFLTTNLYYNSIVFVETNSGQTYNVNFSYDNYFMTFGILNFYITFGIANNNIISQGNNNNNITFGSSNNGLLIGSGNTYIIANNYNTNITLGNNNNAILFGSGNDNILIGNNNNTLTFQDSNNTSIFSYNNSDIIINSLNSNLYFDSGNTSITLNNDNSYITFGDDNYNLIFYSSNDSMVFGNINHNILIITNNHSITFGDNNQKIELHNTNSYLTFGNNNSGNTFTSNILNFDFSGIILKSNFFFNDLDGTGIIFSGATSLLSRNFTCEAFKRVDGSVKLKYCDNNNMIKVGAINGITGSSFQYTSIQLIDNSGNTEVNIIVPTPIIWTLQEYAGDNIVFTGGSRIYVTETGVYKICYSVNVINTTTGGTNIIGSLIRKNGSVLVTSLTSTSNSLITINYTGTNVMPLFAISLNAGDYIELIAFRVGVGNGSVLTVPSGSWIRMEETH